MAAVAAPTAAMAVGAAGFALTWPTFTTPIRDTDLAGAWEAENVANGRLAADGLDRHNGKRHDAVYVGSSVTSITDREINAFLGVSTRTGKLAYVGMDGRPLVTPVWFVVEGGCIVFNTFRKSAKARALARDPRVTLCTDLEEPPYASVQVQGEAELSEDLGELLRVATMIAARYVRPDRAEEFGTRNGVPGELIVRLRPTKVLAGFNLTG